MPIKGISDIRRFSRGGKIRLGEKRKSKGGKEYPAKLDYFLFDPEDSSTLKALKEQFGDKPRKLRIAFPSEDASVVYPQWYKLYTASGLRCKGDGMTATRVLDSGAMQDFDCPGPDMCPFSKEKGLSGRPGCKRIATLNFFLVDWNQLFVWQINTTSFNSIVNINSQLDTLRLIAGRISFVPINLVIKPVTVQPPGQSKQVAYAIDLEFPVGLNDLKALKPLVGGHIRQAALPATDDDNVPDDMYPAAQIGYDDSGESGDEPAVDDDGVVQEPEPDEEQGSPPYDDELIPVDAEPVEPEKTKPKTAAPDPEPAGDSLEDTPEYQDLLKAKPVIARAISGQAKGENWSLEQALGLVKTKLKGLK